MTGMSRRAGEPLIGKGSSFHINQLIAGHMFIIKEGVSMNEIMAASAMEGAKELADSTGGDFIVCEESFHGGEKMAYNEEFFASLGEAARAANAKYVRQGFKPSYSVAVFDSKGGEIFELSQDMHDECLAAIREAQLEQGTSQGPSANGFNLSFDAGKKAYAVDVRYGDAVYCVFVSPCHGKVFMDQLDLARFRENGCQPIGHIRYHDSNEAVAFHDEEALLKAYKENIRCQGLFAQSAEGISGALQERIGEIHRREFGYGDYEDFEM